MKNFDINSYIGVFTKLNNQNIESNIDNLYFYPLWLDSFNNLLPLWNSLDFNSINKLKVELFKEIMLDKLINFNSINNTFFKEINFFY